MNKITAVDNITLDGVMQAPGRADEDTRSGFAYGGWAAPYGAMQHLGGTTMSGALLFGRRTYEDFYSVWPNRKDSPFTPVLNNKQKYVASTTLKDPLPWMNSTLLRGDVGDAVMKLKNEGGEDLVILGSGELVQSLMHRKVIDEFVLCIHPLVLGTGRKLFADDGAYAKMEMIDSKIIPNGVIIATYKPS